METIKLKISEVKPYERNAKKHDKKQIENVMESIRQFGFVQPVVVDKNNVLVIGHCRYAAAKRLKMKQIDAVRVESLTEEQVNKLRLLDNKLNESEWDIELLLEDVPALDWDGFDIDWNLPELEGDEPEVIEDEPPEPPKEAKTKPGDLYQLGRHRLLCGDATKPEDLERLMNGQKADLYLTDPPYNVDYVGKTKDALKIENDSRGDSEFRELLVNSFMAAKECMKAGAAFYIWHADSEGFNFRGACRDVGWTVRECLIWKKNSMVLGRQDYQWQHEPVLYGFLQNGKHPWYSDRKQTTIWNYDKPKRNKDHPTSKPLDLLGYPIQNSSQENSVVIDTFGGSGSTLMACEQLNRICYMMELDPKYASVILRRYVEDTGDDENVYVIRNGEKLLYSALAKEVETSPTASV